jgi:DNA mismatch endonuclease (patch repair protein)
MLKKGRGLRGWFGGRAVANWHHARPYRLPASLFSPTLATLYDSSWRMDVFSKQDRSALMSRIRSKNTQPELIVRSILHRLGYRFRLHVKHLQGRPDIVLHRHRKIVMVQGCFWHGHTCKLASHPKTNQSYWNPKIRRNRSRDRAAIRALAANGWSVLEVWECQIREGKGIVEKLQAFMRGQPSVSITHS